MSELEVDELSSGEVAEDANEDDEKDGPCVVGPEVEEAGFEGGRLRG